MVAIFRGILFQCCNIGAVGKKNVGASIVVVIKHGHAAEHSLRLIASVSLAVLQPEGKGLELEMNGALRPCCSQRQAEEKQGAARPNAKGSHVWGNKRGGRSHP